jgi:hypothetical protein
MLNWIHLLRSSDNSRVRFRIALDLVLHCGSIDEAFTHSLVSIVCACLHTIGAEEDGGEAEHHFHEGPPFQCHRDYLSLNRDS